MQMHVCFAQAPNAVSVTRLLDSTDDWCCVDVLVNNNKTKMLSTNFKGKISLNDMISYVGDTMHINTLLAMYDYENQLKWHTTVNCFAPNYAWAQSRSTSDGGALVVVNYEDSLEIFGIDTIVSRGSSDIAIIKFDSLGHFSWLKQLGTTGADAVRNFAGIANNAILLDLYIDMNRQGQSFAPITYQDVVDTNDFTLNTAFGISQHVIVTLDLSGTVTRYYPMPIATRNIYFYEIPKTDSVMLRVNDGINGISSFTIDGTNYAFPNTGNSLTTGHHLLMLVDSIGKVGGISALHGVGNNSPFLGDLGYSNALALPNGNLAFTGFYTECQVKTYGGGGWIANALSAYNEAFLAVTNRNGTLKWAQPFITGGSDAVWGLQCDDASNVYIAGGLGSAGGIIGANETLANAHAFIAKYDSLGNCLWSKQGTGLAVSYNLQRLNDGALDWQVRTFDGPYTVDGFTAPTPGVYSFRLRDWPSNTTTNTLPSNFVLYPNPTTQYLYIDNTATAIRMIDARGMVHSPPIHYADVHHNAIDCSGLANGLYTVTAILSGNTECKRVMINR
jgi:hypothetical protein